MSVPNFDLSSLITLSDFVPRTNDAGQPVVPETLAELDIVPRDWKWRRGQRELVERIARSPKKIVMVEAECGSGKSIVGIASAKAAGSESTIVLIQTLNLQEQYLRDFHHAKMMAGRSHSLCNLTNKRADRAPCTIKIKCSMMGMWAEGKPQTVPECSYYQRKASAALAETSIQNYAYWLAETSNNRSSFDKADWIICDEAHELDQILMQAATIELRYADLRGFGVDRPPSTSMADLATWARKYHPLIGSIKTAMEEEISSIGLPARAVDFEAPEMHKPAADDDAGDYIGDTILSQSVNYDSDSVEDAITKYHTAVRLLNALEDIRMLEPAELQDWVIDTKATAHMAVKPIYGKYGFRRLMAAAQTKLVLMSAFLAPKLLMQTLGLNPEDVEVIDAGRQFDRSKSKVYFCPLMKMGFKTTDNQWGFVTAVVDRFINFYAPRKGLIHVPSVKLRNTVLNKSKEKHKLIAYDGAGSSNPLHGDKDQAIRLFIHRPGQQVLLGQSISTGLDIPYVPEFQVIVKLPYMPLDDPAILKRKEVDKDFYTYFTICQIVQATGRVKRAQDHDGQTIILDGNFKWFYAANKQHFPAWFRESFVYDGWKAFPGIRGSIKNDALRAGVLL